MTAKSLVILRKDGLVKHKVRIHPLLLSVLAVLALSGSAVPAHATWSLVWSDEFNGAALNLTDWSYDIGTGCPNLCGWGNAELEYYRAQNVGVGGGYLTITAKRESIGGASFTSGKIHTRDKRSFLYGRIEMRAKLPTGGGMWPAFWMMPEDDVYGGWAASGEIDIMESANATTTVGGALHYGGSWPNNTSTSGSYSLGGTSFADDFHVYAVEWEPDQIRWYVDGVLFSSRNSSQWYSEGAPGNPRAPFDQPFYLILNAAVGGYYTGCTEPGCITASFPQEYVIDYVRVYEDIVNEAPTVTITAPPSGGTLPPGDITITATASDNDGTVTMVEFYDGDTLLVQDATAPYEYVWTSVPDGCYLITARVIDDLGGVGTDSADITVGAGCGQAAFLGSPFVLPTRIEAEDFDTGGEGVAYHDLEAANNGGAYRPSEGVDIQQCFDAGGGYNTGWTTPGEWMEYTVQVPGAGDYAVEARVSSLSGGGIFRLEFGGVDVTGDIAVPSTTGWQTWTTISVPVSLTAGTQVMRFVAVDDGFNVNYFDVTGGPTAAAPDLQPAGAVLHANYPNPFNPMTTISFDLPAPGTATLQVFDLGGRLVRTILDGQDLTAGRHETVWNGRDEAGREAAAGTYLYRLSTGGFSETRRMVMIR